jgi:hypothetical protein
MAGNTISPAIRLSGPTVAANPQDRFVVTTDNHIIVTVEDGGVCAHHVTGDTIAPAFLWNGFASIAAAPDIRATSFQL